MTNRGRMFLQPLFGGFSHGDVLRRWRNQMMMADDVVRQPPKDGCIIVAPGWLAYLGLVVE